ncbi:MAG: ornithine carbamoyltransferase [Alphaproteobacteria bacterium]|jgi:ornithine carbamoyltransferase|nr:ornithine carbamoyltransferase [Alphaproteobacteria bacterium]MDP6516089.1 ornithine carbamoyltransferase [Alphaproteobacteria bacterium]
MTALRHFLDLDRIETKTLREILADAASLKSGANGRDSMPLGGRVLAMIFEKPSTRTRVSFEVAMLQLGGQAIRLTPEDTQLGRGETLADTARVLSRLVDGIMIRAARHQSLIELAEHAEVPVINGLTDRSHPCQLLADIMTFEEHRGPIAGRIVAWSGDGNNVANSWIHAAVRFGFELRLACPNSLSPSPEVMAWAHDQGGRVTVTADARAAVARADCVVTDTWVSMGADAGDNRRKLLAPYQVNDALMACADADALFMHCLPAHRGEEVTDAVIDGPRSVVWDEAANRLHSQKGILNWCLG